MIDCISFLTGAGGSAAKPDALCCSGFKSVLKADAHCICQAIREAPQMGIKLNKTRAIELPSDCGVSHFSASKICGFLDSPGTPSAESPKPSPRMPVPPPTKPPTPSPLPPSMSPAPLPRTKPAPSPTTPPVPSPKSLVSPASSPTPTPSTANTPDPSPKSPVSSLPKSTSSAPSSLERGISQVPAPAPENLKSGGYSLRACFAVAISICAIYFSV
ncbi:PlsC domain-containing protein [Psidium guajava]|nr:PlsC domain-containing protein [Psidium guajava]